MSGNDLGDGAGSPSPPSPPGTPDREVTDDPAVTSVPALEERRSPFAVGVLQVPVGAGVLVRAAERLAVALTAHAGGYFLLDVIEMADEPAPGDWARVWGLAAGTDAEAFIVRGPVSRNRLEAFAVELRMVIQDADDPPHPRDAVSLDPPVGAGA